MAYNTTIVLLGTTLLGVSAGVVGSFSLLRRRTLLTDAAAHATLPGVCAAFIFGALVNSTAKSLPLLLLGALLSATLAVLALAWLTRGRVTLTDDVATASVLSVFFAVGVVLLSVIQGLGSGEEGGIHHFIFGQTAALRFADLSVLLALSLAALVTTIVCFEGFRGVAFDREFSALAGLPVERLDTALLGLILLTTVVGLQSVGLLLVVSILVVPAAAARLWSGDLRTQVWLAGVFGAVSGGGGTLLSATLPHAPAGAVIVMVSGVIFFFSFFCSPRWGVLSQLVRWWNQKLRISTDHILREFGERFGDFAVEELLRVRPEIRSFASYRYSTWGIRWIAVRQMISRGELSADGALTELGRSRALECVRRFKLWEEYLRRFTVHGDYAADLTEHLASEELLKNLEERVK